MVKKIFNTKSLSSKILFGQLLILSSVSIFIIYYFTYKQVESKNEILKCLGTTITQDMVDRLDRNYYERYGDVNAFAVNPLTINIVNKSDTVNEVLVNYINKLTQIYVLYDLMICVNKEGNVIGMNTVDRQGKNIKSDFIAKMNFSNEVWFRNVITDIRENPQSWFSDFEKNPLSATVNGNDGAGRSFAYPIRDIEGNNIGAWYNISSWKEITIEMRASVLTELRKSYSNAQMILINKEGLIIDCEENQLVGNVNFNIDEFNNGRQITINTINYNQDDFIAIKSIGKGAFSFNGSGLTSVIFLPKTKFNLLTPFTTNITGTIIVIALTLVLLLITLTFTNKLSSILSSFKNTLLKVSNGELKNADHINTNDELEEMAKSINSLVSKLQDKAEFAQKIGEGDIQANFEAASSNDTLGVALINMRKNLLDLKEEENKKNWIIQGSSAINDLLRVHSDDMDTLYDTILNYAIKVLEGNQGALYILEKNDNENLVLELKSCFAWDKKKYIGQKIEPGVGLVGQTFIEKEYILVEDAPTDYIQITSGLGKATPKNIILSPLVYNESCLGVIELAFFKKLEPFQIEFITKISEMLGSSIEKININNQTKLLLEQSKQSTEELLAQEEEMRQNMEELLTTQEQLEQKSSENEIELEKIKQENERNLEFQQKLINEINESKLIIESKLLEAEKIRAELVEKDLLMTELTNKTKEKAQEYRLKMEALDQELETKNAEIINLKKIINQ